MPYKTWVKFGIWNGFEKGETVRVFKNRTNIINTYDICLLKKFRIRALNSKVSSLVTAANKVKTIDRSS